MDEIFKALANPALISGCVAAIFGIVGSFAPKVAPTQREFEDKIVFLRKKTSENLANSYEEIVDFVISGSGSPLRGDGTPNTDKLANHSDRLFQQIYIYMDSENIFKKVQMVNSFFIYTIGTGGLIAFLSWLWPEGKSYLIFIAGIVIFAQFYFLFALREWDERLRIYERTN
jgi:hypothetical protein